MFLEYVRSLFLIFIAEMGDKTQILAMTFATKWKVHEVLIGVFIGSLLNHGIAVALGTYLSEMLPMDTIQIVAGVLFIGFALWTLKPEEEEEDEEEKKNYGPIVTVALAFFIGELGDKTQLTAITLSVDAQYPIWILLGTVSGMIITSGLGIFIGSKIGDKVPESFIKIISAGIFLFFGVAKLYTTVPKIYFTPTNIIIFTIVLIVAVYIMIRPTLYRMKKHKPSFFKTCAEGLFDQTHGIEHTFMRTNACKDCNQKRCVVGYTQKMIKDAIKGKYGLSSKEIEYFDELTDGRYEKEKIMDSLGMIIVYLRDCEKKHTKENTLIHQARQALEWILFHKTFDYNGNTKAYIVELNERDTRVAHKISQKIGYSL